MSRRPKYTRDQIIDAAQAEVLKHGFDTTLSQVAQRIGAPIGSLYHRFSSREELMATLWVRAIKRWHTRLFEIIEAGDDPNEVLVSMAVETARYCRAHPDEARAMTLYRHSNLVVSCPENLHEEVATINDAIFGRIAELARLRFPARAHDPELVFFVFTSVNQLAYGLVRPFIGSPEPIPQWMDELICLASAAALTLGDEAERLDLSVT